MFNNLWNWMETFYWTFDIDAGLKSFYEWMGAEEIETVCNQLFGEIFLLKPMEALALTGTLRYRHCKRRKDVSSRYQGYTFDLREMRQFLHVYNSFQWTLQPGSSEARIRLVEKTKQWNLLVITEDEA